MTLNTKKYFVESSQIKFRRCHLKSGYSESFNNSSSYSIYELISWLSSVNELPLTSVVNSLKKPKNSIDSSRDGTEQHFMIITHRIDNTIDIAMQCPTSFDNMASQKM